MTTPAEIVFLLDVDNTLIDNDAIIEDLKGHLREVLGSERFERYWEIFETLRAEIGYADYLGALQRFRLDDIRDQHCLEISSFLLEYPFASRLFAGALAVIERLRTWGPTVILSDGDVVFQPRKIQRSGLYDAVEGRVLIYINKERQLDDVENRYQAAHYVLVDDKLRILAAVKNAWDSRVTTIFPRQGHYAHDANVTAAYGRADITVECIADVLDYDLSALRQSQPSPARR
jgi:FMN phosphatase YigB (HAD superfamily)